MLVMRVRSHISTANPSFSTLKRDSSFMGWSKHSRWCRMLLSNIPDLELVKETIADSVKFII